MSDTIQSASSSSSDASQNKPQHDEAFLRALFEATVTNNKWIIQTPTEKQAAFLYLAYEPEVLFGGAAGPGVVPPPLG